MAKWRKVAEKMIVLEKKYIARRKTPIVSVHQTLLKRAVSYIGKVNPAAEEYYLRHMKTMLIFVTRPDCKGDYENGLGRHYYCSVNMFGHRLSAIGGYYKNGLGFFSKSARTMFEEDYTMALTMSKAGYENEASIYLGRAVHMLSDICCLPHGTGMTYFSPFRCVHRAYEKLAKAMYPEFVPEQPISVNDLGMFCDRRSFKSDLNRIAEGLRKEKGYLMRSPHREIVYRLLQTERTVASLLLRFYGDLQLSPEEAHYIADGMRFRIYPDIPPLSANIWEHGIYFTLDGEGVFIQTAQNDTSGVFRAAHRRNGYFTFSPVTDSKGRVIESGKIKAVYFSPLKKNQHFKPIQKKELR